METYKTNPSQAQISFSYLFLFLALVLSLLTGCERDEEIIPQPTETASITSDLVRSFEDVTIYRMELRLVTADVEDAGTDDGVFVQLNGRDRHFFLNKGSDDFRRGRTDTYDVLSPVVKKVRDIRFLKIGLRGDDGVALKQVEMFLNGNRYPVYVKTFAGQGKWLDNNQSYTISSTDLRAHAGWRFSLQHNNLDKPPARLSQKMITSLIENSLGDQMNHMDGLAWGDKTWGLPNTLFGPAVEVSYVNSTTLHVDLDLKRKVGYAPDPEIDVDFDLEFSCNNGIINTQMKNFKFQTNWVGHAYDIIREKIPVLVTYAVGSYAGGPLVGGAAGALVAKVLQFEFKPDLQSPNIPSSCQQIGVNPNGDVVLRNTSSAGGMFVQVK